MSKCFFAGSIVSFFVLFFAVTSCSSDKEKVRFLPLKKAETVLQFHIPALPTEMDFCGEKIDLTDVSLRERLDKEMHTIVYFQSSIFLVFKRANRYFSTIEKTLKESGVPDDFKYLALVESGLDQGRSSAGAQGFWQFMPKTAKEYGMEVNDEVDERRNFYLSTKGAASYLSKAKDSLGNWINAAASYNRGVAGIQKDLKWQSSNHFLDAYLNSETSRYVFRILAMKLIFENPLKYGFDPSKMDLYPQWKIRQVEVEAMENASEWALENGINYKILVTLNPWIQGNELKARQGGYTIDLPKDDSQFKIYAN